MDDITIKIDSETLAECVRKVLSAAPNILGGNPLAKVIAKALEDSAPTIHAKVQSVLREFVASPELERNMRAIYRDALHGEAARMGRNAARAMVNAQPEQPKPQQPEVQP